jgi:ABC-2 type transport system permease protein
VSLVRDLIGSRELLANLTAREVKGKYKRTALGQLWSLASPIALMVIYTIVFALFIKVKPEPGTPSGLNVFALWLMCGLLPWSFFANVLGGGMSVLVANESLIKKVWFPRVVLPVSNAAATMSTWLLEMLVLLVALLLFGGSPLPWGPLVMVFMVVLALFATGMSLALSVLNVHFRDVQYLMSIVLQAWFYLTPVVYPSSLVLAQSDKFGPLFGGITFWDLYRLNPLENFLDVFRSLLYDNRLPTGDSVLRVLIWTVVSLVIGAWVFARHQDRLAEEL